MTDSVSETPAPHGMLINRVKKNQRRLKNWCHRHQVTCYRLYNADIPEIPMLIDWYDGRLHASVLSGKRPMEITEEHEWASSLLQKLAEALEVPPDRVFLKTRHRGPGGRLYPAKGDAVHCFEVCEGDLRFRVNLKDYVDTGLFLDHRITRRMVQDEARGKHFLNLFGYTGAFTVYAAAGGARTTTTVDLSNTYLDWTLDNLELNGFHGFNHRLLRKDILGLLDENELTEKFDLVVMDPPTVSKSKAMKQQLILQRDHVWMLNRILARVVSGGVLYFSTNFREFRLGDAISARQIKEITDNTVPPDFANHRPHRCWRMVR